ncbi:MAG TPA: hypothetical protein VN229_10895 [Terriglobales bacterium]|nr:hypothetical protein [Terriglobales bacterium]
MYQRIVLLFAALAAFFSARASADTTLDPAGDHPVIVVSSAGSPWDAALFRTTDSLFLVIYNDGRVIVPNPVFRQFVGSADFYRGKRAPSAFKTGRLKAVELKALQTEIDADLHDVSGFYDGCATHPEICFPDLNPPGSTPPFARRIRPTDQNDQIVIEYAPASTEAFARYLRLACSLEIPTARSIAVLRLETFCAPSTVSSP